MDEAHRAGVSGGSGVRACTPREYLGKQFAQDHKLEPLPTGIACQSAYNPPTA